MMVTSARHVGRYEGVRLAGGMGHVQKDRDNNLGSGVSDAGYCLSARRADGSRNRSHDDYYKDDQRLSSRLRTSLVRLSRLGSLIPLAAKRTPRKPRERSII